MEDDISIPVNIYVILVSITGVVVSFIMLHFMQYTTETLSAALTFFLGCKNESATGILISVSFFFLAYNQILMMTFEVLLVAIHTISN